MNPGKFYHVFKESVPYFSGYRYVSGLIITDIHSDFSDKHYLN